MFRNAFIILSFALASSISCDGGKRTVVQSDGGGGDTAEFRVADLTVNDAPFRDATLTTDGSGLNDGGWESCFSGESSSVSWELKTCSMAGPACLIREHQVDCCGTIRYVGVAASEVTTFEACEKTWRNSLPDCDCMAQQPQAEQPLGAPVGPDGAAVDCTNCTMSSCVCMTSPFI
jgi:hypothetical protein